MSQVLLVAERPGVRRGIELMLETDHHAVESAATGSEALLCVERADLLVCVEGLPDYDAVDLCRQAQERAPGPLPCLLLCLPETSTSERAAGLANAAAMPLPFSSVELRERVDELVASRRPDRGTTHTEAQSELADVEGLVRAVVFSASGRVRSLWGERLGETAQSHLRNLVATAEGLLGARPSEDRTSIGIESGQRVWVLHQLATRDWLALEVGGGRPLGPARLVARRAAKRLEAASAESSRSATAEQSRALSDRRDDDAGPASATG